MHDLVVVLDERAVPSGAWLEPLVQALADPSVAAVAPRTNIADGDELLVGVPYRAHEAGVHRAFVGILAQQCGGQFSDAEVLAGPCLALRRKDFLDAGGATILSGADAVAVLARRVARSGRLLVSDGSYLHSGGGPPPRPRGPSHTRPFVSACLIVKDEHDNLGRCLSSLGGLCDEIVVYDTGSTDDTKEIAREAGARVVEGYWDGDFSRARNACLDHCQGQWILWIDADEELVCDSDAQRQELDELGAGAEGLVVMIDNVKGTRASTTMAHPACRLFRRASCRWTGHLHEQVVARVGTRQPGISAASFTRLTHWGYLASDFEARDKGRRNLTSAFRDLVSGSDLSWPARLVNLGRSYGICDRHEQAIEICRAALAAKPDSGTRRLALRTIVTALLSVGRADEALSAAEELRECTRVPTLAHIDAGRALLMLGRADEALRALERVEECTDDDGFEYGPRDVAVYKSMALSLLGRQGDAADVLLSTLRRDGGLDVHLGTLVGCLDDARRPISEIVDAVPKGREVVFLGQLLNLEPEEADRVLEVWHERAPGKAVLAAASKVAPGLSTERRSVWSERLREQGLQGACPLVSAAANPRTALGAISGAAVAADRFGDTRGRMAFGAQARAVPTAREARRRVCELAPSLLPLFDELAARPSAVGDPLPPATGRSVLVFGLRTSSIRSMAVAASLRRAGHQVCCVLPGPEADTRAVLDAVGVDCAGAGDPLTAAGALCATRRFDVVVSDRHAAGMIDELRRLFPGSQMLVDVDDTLPTAEHARCALLSMGRIDGVSSLVLPSSAPHLFAAPQPVPEQLRVGLCVVGDFSDASGDELAAFEQLVAPDLSRRLTGVPFAVVGQGARRVADALGSPLVTGPLADPTPWLSAARAVLVVTRAGAAHWLAAAAMCGTPALALPSAPAGHHGAAQLVAALAALTDPEAGELWRRFAPRAMSSPVPALADPLLHVAVSPAHGPCRRTGGDRPTVAVTGRPELADGLRGDPRVEVVRDPDEARVEVRLGSVDFTPSSSTRLVVEVRWGYGPLPCEWIGPIRDVVDEVWVPTTWAREEALTSGVPATKVQVVPAGVDTATFSPAGPALALATRRTNKVLFAGDCSERSGLDALLEAYLTGFSKDDDVCLVVCPTAPAGALLDEARRAARARGHPEVVVVEEKLAPEGRAALYRACDLAAFCDRAPGDLALVLEAMACGRPVLVAGEGLFAQVCGGEAAYLAAARRAEVAPKDAGVLSATGQLWRVEPSRTSLAECLRRAVHEPEARRRKGEAARHVASGWSLSSAVNAAAGCLTALCAGIDGREQLAAAISRSSAQAVPSR